MGAGGLGGGVGGGGRVYLTLNCHQQNDSVFLVR